MNSQQLKFLSENTRIDISNINTEALLQEMNEMFSYIERIDSLPLDNLTDFEHPLIQEVSFREDTIKESYSPKEILKNAPKQENNTIVVPKII